MSAETIEKMAHNFLLRPRNLTNGVYAPKQWTAFTAHIKKLNGLAIISVFHLSCMSNVLMWV